MGTPNLNLWKTPPNYATHITSISRQSHLKHMHHTSQCPCHNTLWHNPSPSPNFFFRPRRKIDFLLPNPPFFSWRFQKKKKRKKKQTLCFRQGRLVEILSFAVKVLTKVKFLANQIAQICDLSQIWGLPIFKNSVPGLSQKKERKIMFWFQNNFYCSWRLRDARKKDKILGSPKYVFTCGVQGFRRKLPPVHTIMQVSWSMHASIPAVCKSG